MHTVADGLSVVAPILPGKEAAVQQVLSSLNNDPGGDPRFPADQFETTHWITWVMIPEQERSGKKLPASVMLLTTFYGDLASHYDDLVRLGAAGLREVFQHCEGFKDKAKTSEDALLRYLKKYKKFTTFYSGYQYLTRDDIRNENALRDAIEDYIENQQQSGGFDGKSAVEVRTMIQDFVRSRADLAWSIKPWKLSSANYWKMYGRFNITAAILAILVLLAIGAIFWPHPVTIAAAILLGLLFGTLGTLILWLRAAELRKNQHISQRAPDAKIAAIAKTERHEVTNEMTIAGPLKPGLIRRIFFPFGLFMVKYNRGRNYISTVSSARWLAIDGGRRLIFVAYYTNTSVGYARDFVDAKGTAMTLNLIFGHGYGYEPTRWALHDGGAKNPKSYMNSVHQTQTATEYWYYRNPSLSVDNITNNHAIREGLWRNMGEAEAQGWLLKL